VLEAAPTLTERNLRLALDGGPTLIAYIDTGSHYRLVNRTHEHWFGTPVAMVEGRHMREIVGEVSWRIISPYVERALAGEAVDFEQELHFSGRKRWVRAAYTPDRDETGHVRGFVEHVIDIGEYKRAEEDLLTGRWEAEETQRATLNILEDFDEERAKLKQIQQATMNLLEDFDEERSNLQEVQKATLNLLEDMNEERNRLDETQRALLNMLEDIEVERAKAEQSKSLLESVNQELEAFSYSVSHDLRAPLRAISGFAQAVVEDYEPRLDDEGKRYLGLIQANSHKMGQLIDDLLAFSRLGRQQLIATKIDMDALAKSVFEELLTQSPTRAIHFITRTTPAAYGDKAMIRQVLTNLLANAVKFTRTRSEALIEFGNLPDAHAFRQDEKNDGVIEPGAPVAEEGETAEPILSGGGIYFVKDNGVGFDMHYVSKLFGVFQRLHDVTEFEGTGVGLALVSRIITRHGGRVWATGKEDQGATFYFTLPGREK